MKTYIFSNFTRPLTLIGQVLGMGCLLAAAFCLPAKANGFTYTYAGPHYTTINGPYTRFESISGSITLASSLGANAPFAGVTPTAFSFFDGVQTFTDADTLVRKLFSFSTDATGAIALWNVQLNTTFTPTYFGITTQNHPQFGFGDIANFSVAGGFYTSTTLTTGVWTSPAGAAPEPSSLFLSLSALSAVVFAARKRLSHSS